MLEAYWMLGKRICARVFHTRVGIIEKEEKDFMVRGVVREEHPAAKLETVDRGYARI